MKKLLAIILICLFLPVIINCNKKSTDPEVQDDKTDSFNTLMVSASELIKQQDSTQIDIFCGTEAADTINGLQNVTISLQVTNGSAKVTSGQTDAEGKFSTFIFSENTQDSISIAINASYNNGQKDTTVFTYIAQPGLKASYSNGVDTIEAPVFNGWWGDCASTGNNYYMGQCTNVSDSPVDWAWGYFSASWEGYIFIPDSGEYRFNSHYWVDGAVYITINDSLIVDMNTHGGGFGKYISFSERNWYPVYMTFASNGGSNNMHLGWTKPGEDWEPVPAENLAHR